MSVGVRSTRERFDDITADFLRPIGVENDAMRPDQLVVAGQVSGAGPARADDALPEVRAHDGFMSAVDIQRRIQNLKAERVLASIQGLDEDIDYMADLEDELATMRHAYAVTAVTEIATLKARLSGRLAG